MPAQNSITTTLTAAASYDLVLLADVQLELNISNEDSSQDAWLAKQITRSSRAVQSYCKRKFVVESLQDVINLRMDNFPWQLPNGVDTLQLSAWPVGEVTSVVVNLGPSNFQTLTAGIDYELDAAAGQLTRLFSITTFPIQWVAAPTTVQFSAGFSEIPDDVQLATLKLITSAFQARGRDPYTKRINQAGGIGEIEYWVPSQKEGDFTPDISELLDNYRVPSAG
jgi:hypothetical protein